MFGKKNSALYCAMAIFSVISLLLLYGCADREELEEARRQEAPGFNTEANEALNEAEDAMAEAGIDINFSELSGLESLADLSALLPDPLEIAQFEKQQKIEEAIDALYAVLDALGASDVSGAPTMVNSTDISISDLALIHLELSYCEVLAAVSHLTMVGFGPDGVKSEDDLYYIDFAADPEAESLEIYKFTLADRIQELMDSVDPDVDPYGYIKVFYAEGHVDDEGHVEELQAIIDALWLLLGAEVAVVDVPSEGIKAHEPQVDRQTYRHYALYHLEKAMEFARKISPDLEDALNELDEEITKYFSKGILEYVKEWGFEIRKVPERYEYLLEE